MRSLASPFSVHSLSIFLNRGWARRIFASYYCRAAPGALHKATPALACALARVYTHPRTMLGTQELERWNNLVNKMASSLSELDKALKGIVGMSKELDEVADALFNGFLPASWRRLAPSTEKGLGSWMAHFQRRLGLSVPPSLSSPFMVFVALQV